MPSEREITIWVHYKSFGATYFTDRDIDLDEISLDEKAWLTKVLRKLSVDSITNRLNVAFVYCIKSAISYLRSDPEAWELCNIQEENITARDIRIIFQALETKLTSSKITGESKRQISGKFRYAVLRTEFNTTEKICTETVNFKTSLGKIKANAQSILNLEEHLTSLDKETPLGAIPHTNYLDLIEKSLNILQSDLQKIINSCVADLSVSKENREIIKRVESLKLCSDQKEKIGEILYKATSTLTHSITESNAPEIIIAAYRQTVNERTEISKRNETLNFHALTENCKAIGIDLRKGYSSRQTFFSPDRLTTVELQAIFILLLCRTGWNRDALVEMRREGIIDDEPGFAFVLQGFKTKSDDDTPPIYIEKTESEIIDAVELLIWSYNQLRQLGIVDSTNDQLWYSWTNSDCFVRSSTMIQMKPNDFIKRNCLFDFSLKQIRSTVLSIDAYRSKSYETARQRGGHSSLGTTGRYLDHIITRSIASSINLQFQSDLEKKIIFNLDSRKKVIDDTSVRIGDGSTCSDAYSGLYSDRGADSICSAQRCHENGGCPNRRIVIDEESIADIIRVRNYYFKNWQRIRNDNQNKFNIQVAPKVAFNDALYNFVKNSRFGHILDEIEAVFMHREKTTNEY